MTGLQERFGFDAHHLEYRPRYNIAPTQEVLAVTADGDQRQAQYMRWGLVPFWAKDTAIGYKMINSRAETVGEACVPTRLPQEALLGAG